MSEVPLYTHQHTLYVEAMLTILIGPTLGAIPP